MARTCDLCSGKPANETTITISKTIPGDWTRQNKQKSDRHSRLSLGDLCDPCTDRYAVLVGNLVASVKTGETALPEAAPPESVDLTQEAEAERQESLPLGGDDRDSGPIEGENQIHPLASTDESDPEVTAEPAQHRKRDRKPVAS